MGAVLEATVKELEALKGRSPALEQIALALAEVVDVTTSARDIAALTRELRATIDAIHKAPPAKGEVNPIDQLAEKRRARRATASGQ